MNETLTQCCTRLSEEITAAETHLQEAEVAIVEALKARKIAVEVAG